MFTFTSNWMKAFPFKDVLKNLIRIGKSKGNNVKTFWGK